MGYTHESNKYPHIIIKFSSNRHQLLTMSIKFIFLSNLAQIPKWYVSLAYYNFHHYTNWWKMINALFPLNSSQCCQWGKYISIRLNYTWLYVRSCIVSIKEFFAYKLYRRASFSESTTLATPKIWFKNYFILHRK